MPLTNNANKSCIILRADERNTRVTVEECTNGSHHRHYNIRQCLTTSSNLKFPYLSDTLYQSFWRYFGWQCFWINIITRRHLERLFYNRRHEWSSLRQKATTFLEQLQASLYVPSRLSILVLLYPPYLHIKTATRFTAIAFAVSFTTVYKNKQGLQRCVAKLCSRSVTLFLFPVSSQEKSLT